MCEQEGAPGACDRQGQPAFRGGARAQTVGHVGAAGVAHAATSTRPSSTLRRPARLARVTFSW